MCLFYATKCESPVYRSSLTVRRRRRRCRYRRRCRCRLRRPLPPGRWRRSTRTLRLRPRTPGRYPRVSPGTSRRAPPSPYERRRSRPRYRFERLRLPLYRVRTERARLSENPRRPMVLASASPMYRLCASVTRADSARASTARSVDARRARRRIVGDGRGEGGARSAGPHRRRLRRVNHDATRENGRASRRSRRQFLQPDHSETTGEISRLNALAMSDTTTNLRLPPVRLFSEKYNRPGGRKRDISRGC